MDDRLEKIEEAIMRIDHTVEQLNAVVLEHTADIKALRDRIVDLEAQLPSPEEPPAKLDDE